MTLRERFEKFLIEKKRTVISVARDAGLDYDTLRRYRVKHRKGSPDFLSKLNTYLKEWGY